MGVPILCRLGHCVPLYPASSRGPYFRQEAVGPAYTRVVHEARWSNSSLRVELFGRQPTGTRLVCSMSVHRPCARIYLILSRATFRVFKIERKLYGTEDFAFLERVFQKLLLNFTWWVNRKDAGGNNVFEGGFLGLDNIGLFNRSEPLPTGGTLRQADGTAWMAFYCLNM